MLAMRGAARGPGLGCGQPGSGQRTTGSTRGFAGPGPGERGQSGGPRRGGSCAGLPRPSRFLLWIQDCF